MYSLKFHPMYAVAVVPKLYVVFLLAILRSSPATPACKYIPELLIKLVSADAPVLINTDIKIISLMHLFIPPLFDLVYLINQAHVLVFQDATPFFIKDI